MYHIEAKYTAPRPRPDDPLAQRGAVDLTIKLSVEVPADVEGQKKAIRQVLDAQMFDIRDAALRHISTALKCTAGASTSTYAFSPHQGRVILLPQGSDSRAELLRLDEQLAGANAEQRREIEERMLQIRQVDADCVFRTQATAPDEARLEQIRDESSDAYGTAAEGTVDVAIDCLERELETLTTNHAVTAATLATGGDTDLVDPIGQQDLRRAQIAGLREGIERLRGQANNSALACG